MKREKGFTLIELMIVLAIIAITATLVISNLASSRISGNETSAIKTLRAVQEMASIFKKQLRLDADANGVGEYPTCGAGLAPQWATLVDINNNPLIGLQSTGGVSHGYMIAVAAGTTTPENTCYADATPQAVGVSGNRTFCQANDGVGYHSPSGAAVVQDYLPSDGGDGTPGGDFVVVQE